jgi:hypothetical protein
MASKPKRSWFDVQMTIMTVSMASALGLWNLFAGPDRETALRKAVEAQAARPEPVELPPTPEVPVPIAQVAPLPKPGEKIMLGASPHRPRSPSKPNERAVGMEGAVAVAEAAGAAR